jgi:ComF family protein
LRLIRNDVFGFNLDLSDPSLHEQIYFSKKLIDPVKLHQRGIVIQRENKSIAYRWKRSILNLLYPPLCVGCGASGFFWCPSCQESLRIIQKPTCLKCGMPHARSRHGCERCEEYPETLFVRSYAHYEGSLLRALVHLKYRPNQDVARIMGRWLAEICEKNQWRGTVIIPVPLGKKRIKQRGYNQAKLISDGLADEIGVPVRNNILLRTRETRSQVGLDPTARFDNVQNAFQARPHLVKNQVVFLVDDLLTTGATLVACTEALIEAGVSRVFGLTVARA